MRRPCALTIAGLDPGGGAGIAADLRAFAAAGAFGCAAAAVLTVQSTSGLLASSPVSATLLSRQIKEVVRRQAVRVVKTGALGSAANVRAVRALLARHPRLLLVVDPVLRPTQGRARLLLASAEASLRDDLLPRAALVTANAPEAAALTGLPVRTPGEARAAASRLVSLGARAALVKGGHVPGDRVVDVLALGATVHVFSATRLRLPLLHGGGCTLASLVAGRLAVDATGSVDARVLRAVRWARRVHRRALARAVDVGGQARVLVP